MMQVSLDEYDRKILAALVQNGALTNAQLSEIVNLSPSQCSRRRINLEAKGNYSRIPCALGRRSDWYRT